MALLSSTTLRTDYLPEVQAADTASMTTLAAALARAEATIAEHLGYPGASPTWESTSYTLRLRAVVGDRLILPVAPVTAIASVYQDESMVFGADTAVSPADYEREDLKGGAILHLLPEATSVATWSDKHRAVKVTCTAGYANEAAIPKGLAHAVYGWVADWWLRRRVRHLENTSQGGTSQTFAALAKLPADVAAQVAPWMLLGRLGAS